MNKSLIVTDFLNAEYRAYLATTKYGCEPFIIGEFTLVPTEMCFIQYMPIKMPHSDIRMPKNLAWTQPLLDYVMFEDNDYVYITAKHMFVTPDNMGNRGGWHTDGFGTPDINYSWVDIQPTEYAVQDFQITEDDIISLQEMEAQVRPECIIRPPENALVLMDKHCVHRVPDLQGKINQPILRTFVRFSVSRDQYNMFGNAHNPLFGYEWEMQKRKADRNNTAKY